MSTTIKQAINEFLLNQWSAFDHRDIVVYIRVINQREVLNAGRCWKYRASVVQRSA